MNKSKLIYIILLFLLFGSLLDARSFRDPGLYGSLSFIYTDDIYDDQTDINTQEKLTQEYKLGYRGNIYSPKLIDYKLETIFRYEDLTNDNRGIESTSKVKSQDYRIDVNFLKSTKIPFRMYYRDFNRPTSFIYGNSVSKYTQDLVSKGLSGSILLDSFLVNYSTAYSNDIFETATSVQHRESANSEISVSKNEKNYNVKLSYSTLDQSTKTDTLTNVTTQTINEQYDRALLTYMWKISDTLRFNGDINYYDSKYLLSESISTNALLAWTPSEDYSASISANATSIKQTTNTADELGKITKSTDTITTSGMSQSFTYRITENFRFTETFSYLNYGSITSAGNSRSLNLGLSYALRISPTTRGNISTTINQRVSTLTLARLVDQNDTFSDETTNSYTISAGLTKQFETAESRANINLRYSGTQSSDNRESTNMMLISSLTSRFWYILHNNLVFSYSEDNSNYIYTNIYGEIEDSKVSRISLSDTLSHRSRLGIKGNINTSLSINYTSIDNNGNMITRVMPKLNLALNYRFWQRLMYKLNIGVYKDLSYNYLNYYATTGLSYEIGKTSMSVTYNYNLTGIDSGTEITSLEKSKLEARIIRRF